MLSKKYNKKRRWQDFRKYFVSFKLSYNYVWSEKCLVGRMLQYLETEDSNVVAKYFGFKSGEAVGELMYCTNFRVYANAEKIEGESDYSYQMALAVIDKHIAEA